MSCWYFWTRASKADISPARKRSISSKSLCPSGGTCASLACVRLLPLYASSVVTPLRPRSALVGLCIRLEMTSITNVTRRWHFSYVDIHSLVSIIHIFSTEISPVCQACVDELECLDVWHYSVACS